MILPSRPARIGEKLPLAKFLIKPLWSDLAADHKYLADSQASSTRPRRCQVADAARRALELGRGSGEKPVLMLPRTRLYVSFYHVRTPTRDPSRKRKRTRTFLNGLIR